MSSFIFSSGSMVFSGSAVTVTTGAGSGSGVFGQRTKIFSFFGEGRGETRRFERDAFFVTFGEAGSETSVDRVRVRRAVFGSKCILMTAITVVTKGC